MADLYDRLDEIQGMTASRFPSHMLIAIYRAMISWR